MATWTRLLAPVLSSTRVTWALAVATDMNNKPAISALLRPRPIASATSRSRPVNDSRRAAASSCAARTPALRMWATTVLATDGDNIVSPAATVLIAVHQVRRRRVLHQEAVGTGSQGVEHVIVGVERGQHDDVRRARLFGDPARRLDPVETRHANIHQHHVGKQCAHGGHRRFAVARFAHHGQVRTTAQHQPERRPHERVVVDDQHPDRVHVRHGSHARTLNSVADSVVSSRPCATATRSAIPTRPSPAPGAGDGPNPRWLVIVTTTASVPSLANLTRNSAPGACLAALVIPSCTMRYIVRPVSVDGGVRDVRRRSRSASHQLRTALDQRGDVEMRRLRLFHQIAGRRIAQHVQNGPQLAQRLVGGIADHRRLGSHLFGAEVVTKRQGTGTHRNLGDPVRHHVVHLACDPRALGGTAPRLPAGRDRPQPARRADARWPAAADTEPMISVEHVTKSYGAYTAVNDVSFESAPGEITGFLGPNGAGKSTTMRIMVGLTPATSGRVTLNGRVYRDIPNPGRHVGILLDASAQHAGRTGREILTIGAMTMGLPSARVDEMLASVGLTESESQRRLRDYSLGMKQRLGIAHALLGDPEILILDEPANGLDPAGIRWMRGLLAATPIAVAACCYRATCCTRWSLIADRMILIGSGRIVASGDRAELLQLGGGAATIAHADDPVAFAAALDASQIAFRADGSLVHVFAPPVDVGRLAARHQIALIELRAQQDGLEDLFLALTASDARDQLEGAHS